MCGLYSMTTAKEAVRQLFPKGWQWSETADLFEPSAKVGPSAKGPGSPSNIRLVALQTEGVTRFGTMRWRYEMKWMREMGRRPPINAKIETLFSNGMFKYSARDRRCLIVVDAFYEPKGPKPKPGDPRRDQYIFNFGDGRPFALGGIWAHYKAEDDDFFGFAIVTTNPGEPVADIHDRSPVILDSPAEWETWLEGDQGEVMVFEEPIDRPDLVACQM